MPVELHTEIEDEYFTTQEINQLLKNLSNADIYRLREIAGHYARLSLIEADDLVNDAILAIASGDRKFKREVPLIAFFAGIMKSLAYNEKRKQQKFISIDYESDNNPILNKADESIDIEKNIIEDQELKEIYDLFENDDDVTLLLMARFEGKTPNECCEIADWDITKYYTVSKRLRRALKNRFTNGREI